MIYVYKMFDDHYKMKLRCDVVKCAIRTHRRANSPTAPTISTMSPINRATHSTTAIAVPTASTTRHHHLHCAFTSCL